VSNLILPPQYAQMAKPVVFWFNRSADFIMLPASPIAPPPKGFERIECRHAHEVDIWSRRLRRQEQRVREMTEVERFEYEGKIQSGIIEEMKRCLANSTDPTNKQFLAYFIAQAEKKREDRRLELAVSYMECEASEGVAS